MYVPTYHIKFQTNEGKLNEEMINKKMSEGMNNDEKWKSLWQKPLNTCFDEGKIK